MLRSFICFLVFACCCGCTSNENPNTINSVESKKKDSITKATLPLKTDTIPTTIAAIQSTYELITSEMNNAGTIPHLLITTVTMKRKVWCGILQKMASYG